MRRFAFVALAALFLVPAHLQAQDYRLLMLHGHYLKWGPPEFGVGSQVTYGYVARERSFENAINCRQVAPLGDLLERWEIEPTAFNAAVSDAFEKWEEAADLRFRKAESDEEPDILLGAQARPRGIAYANVQYDTDSADANLASLTQASICLNPSVPWKLNDSTGGTAYSLEVVLAHEIGHAIGLDHPGATGQLMGYSYQEEITGLMPGDIAGAARLYGEPR